MSLSGTTTKAPVCPSLLVLLLLPMVATKPRSGVLLLLLLLPVRSAPRHLRPRDRTPSRRDGPVAAAAASRARTTELTAVAAAAAAAAASAGRLTCHCCSSCSIDWAHRRRNACEVRCGRPRGRSCESRTRTLRWPWRPPTKRSTCGTSTVPLQRKEETAAAITLAAVVAQHTRRLKAPRQPGVPARLRNCRRTAPVAAASPPTSPTPTTTAAATMQQAINNNNNNNNSNSSRAPYCRHDAASSRGASSSCSCGGMTRTRRWRSAPGTRHGCGRSARRSSPSRGR